MKKILSVLSLTLALILAACAGPGEAALTDASSDAEQTTGEQLLPLSLCDSGAVYTMIRSENASEVFKSMYSQLYKDIKEATGVTPQIKDDFLFDNEQPADLEILVGPTNRPESAEAMENLEGGGFVVCVIGKKIVINGSTDKHIASAVAWFKDNILASGAGDISPELLYTENGIYLLKNVNINGIPISSFRIASESRTAYQLPINTFKGYIQRYSGHTLEIGAEGAEHLIVIGPSIHDSSKKYSAFQTEIYWKNGNLYLGAGSPSAAEQVIDTFFARYMGKAGNCTVTLKEGEVVYSSTEPDWGERAEIMSDQDRVVRSCKKLQELLEFDALKGLYFSYKNSDYESTIAAARSKGNRKTNCVIVTNWVLKDAGFYTSGTFNQKYNGECGYVFSNDNCRKGILEHFDVIKAFRKVSDLRKTGDLYPGDVIVFSSLEHMQTIVDMNNAMDGGRSNCFEHAVGSNFRWFLGSNNFFSATAGYIFRAKDAIPAQ